MNKTVFLLLLGIALVPAGCTMAPKYTRPKAPVPAEWPNGPAYSDVRGATNVSTVPDLRWQEFFSDEKLQQVIGMALTNNRDLRLAALNVERARAMYGIARAELLPVVNGTASGGRQRVPADLSGTVKAQTSGQYGVNLGVASWEIDFFGRIQSLKNEALAQYLATEQARRSAQILLVSSVASAYLALAADRENLALSQTTLVAQQDSYNLAKRRYDLGLTTELDLYRAQTPVDVARRDVAIYLQQVAQDEKRLEPFGGNSGAKPAPCI
jgi:outer membrane protein, multidrug efflux system